MILHRPMNQSPLRWILVLLALCPLLAQAAEEPERAKVQVVTSTDAVQGGGKGLLAVVVDIAKGFHAQSNKPLAENLIPLEVTFKDSGPVKFDKPVYPPGHIEDYPALGKLSVYSGRTIIFVPFTVAADAKPGALELPGAISYQICDDKTCFAPEEKELKLSTRVAAPGEQIKQINEEIFKGYDPSASRSATRPAAAPAVIPPSSNNLKGLGLPKTFQAALGLAFLAGILFNIVPCVLPVLPLKVLGFVEVAQHDRTKTITLSIVFGLGIVTVFAGLSVLVLVFKVAWGEQFSNPIFAWGMVALLLAMALWMFGFFNINLPTGVYSFAPRHDTYFGNYAMGILTAVLSTPCTGPLFPPILFWAGQQPPALGMSALTMVGVGMAFPYIILSIFPGLARRFPRVGPWAELFKQMMGFIILGFAAYFAAGRITDTALALWMIVPVALLAALYLMGRTAQLSNNARAVAIASVIGVSLVSASVAWVAKRSGLLTAKGAAAESVAWIPYSDDALQAARKSGKPALVKFTASWCITCQYVEGTVFQDPQAIAALRKYGVVTFKADLTSNKAPGWTRLKQLSSSGGIPLTAVYFPGEDEPVKLEAIYQTPSLVNALEAHLNKAVASGQ